MPVSFFRIQDIADILIMTFLIYQLYSWFRKTRAMQVLLGLGVVTLIYFATRFLGLYMTSWVLQELGTVLILLVVVVFQAEIRQALYRFSLMRYFFDGNRVVTNSHFKELAETLFVLAEKRVGAIVVLQREESLADYMLNGVRLGCEVTPQILETIFCDGTPLHDGAILIRDGRIDLAACHLPLSVASDIPQHFGTRHRAALGLSERSDALVLVVSEERGAVSYVMNGEMFEITSAAELISVLEEFLQFKADAPGMTIWQRMFSNLLPKVSLLLAVSVFWALITSRQGQITTVSVPLRFHGLPDSLVVVETAPENLEIQLKSLSSLVPTPAKLDILADIDLSDVRDGVASIRVKNSDVSLPLGVVISSISPTAVKVQAEKKVRKKVPVKLLLRGSLPANLKGIRIVCEPATIEVEGAASQVAKIDHVITEEVDAMNLVKGKEYQKNLQAPSKQVTLLRDEPIILRLQSSRDKR